MEFDILMHFQVNKDKRWDEVASSLKLDGRKLNYQDILLKLYALFLFHYEQIYFYRGPEKSASMPGIGANPIVSQAFRILPFICFAESMQSARCLLRRNFWFQLELECILD